MKLFRDIKTVLLLDIKRLFANRLALLTLLVATAVFLVISSSLMNDYKEKASLPIGVLDEDQSELSKKVVESLKETEGFTVHEWTKDELEDGLSDETLYAYFVINEGFEEKMMNCDTQQVISMYYLQNYNFVSILSDIFAKSVMEELLLYEGNSLYTDTIKKYDLEETVNYIDYIQKEELESTGFFEYEYYKVNKEGASKSIEVKNQILTYQIFLGILTIFLSFLSMFFILCERRGKQIRIRMRICNISMFIQEAGDMLFVLLTQYVISLFAAIYIYWLLEFSTIAQFFGIYLYMVLFVTIMVFVFAVISKLLSGDTVYQSVGVIVIFLTGCISILASIGQLTIPFLEIVAKNIPNYWFIVDITDIILAGEGSVRVSIAVFLIVLGLLYTIITDLKLKVIAR